MRRVIINIEEDQFNKLKETAYLDNVSMSFVIRELLEKEYPAKLGKLVTRAERKRIEEDKELEESSFIPAPKPGKKK